MITLFQKNNLLDLLYLKGYDMKKRVLITGSSGYIGSHLQKMLQEKYEVYCLDIVEPKIDTVNFKNVDIRVAMQSNDEFDCIIHLAALVNVGESVHFPTDYYTTNVRGTINLIHGIKTKNFIFASTGAAVEMQSPYGISKRMAEHCVSEFCSKTDTPYTIFRFYNVIGSDGIDPTNKDGLFYNLINAMNTGSFTVFGNDYNTPDGTCIRDYVHVLEVCNAIELAIENPSNSIENLGHGKGTSVTEIVTCFKNVNNVDFAINYGSRREGDIEVSVLSNPSSYMKQLYSIEELLKVDNKLESVL